MSKAIIWQNASGHIRVTFPSLPILVDETEQGYLERVVAKIGGPSFSGYSCVGSLPADAVPVKQTLLLPGASGYLERGGWESNPIHTREAWVWQSGQIAVDPERYRAEYLRAFNREYQRRLSSSRDRLDLLSDSGTTQEIVRYRQYRQSLRDLAARVAGDLKGLMTVSGIAGYEPPWPQEPQ